MIVLTMGVLDHFLISGITIIEESYYIICMWRQVSGHGTSGTIQNGNVFQIFPQNMKTKRDTRSGFT